MTRRRIFSRARQAPRVTRSVALHVAPHVAPHVALHVALHAALPLALLLQATVLGAQAANDSSLLARADSITVGDYCAAVRTIMSKDTVLRALDDQRILVEFQVEQLCDPRVAPMSLRSLTGSGSASLAAVARRRQSAYQQAAAAPLDTVMRIVRSQLRGPFVRPLLPGLIGDSAAQAFTRIAETAQLLFVREARERSLRRVANYERKLGPTSPQLNGVEVLLNYSAQRWIPGFAPSVTRGPSPLELIATYVPTYATITDSKAVAVSASEFGVRGYLFGDGWGKTGRMGIIKPSYWSLGALAASDRSGALAWPWDGRTRTGAFIGWGEMKVGYVPGRKGSVIVTRQMQVIPFVF